VLFQCLYNAPFLTPSLSLSLSLSLLPIYFVSITPSLNLSFYLSPSPMFLRSLFITPSRLSSLFLSFLFFPRTSSGMSSFTIYTIHSLSFFVSRSLSVSPYAFFLCSLSLNFSFSALSPSSYSPPLCLSNFLLPPTLALSLLPHSLLPPSHPLSYPLLSLTYQQKRSLSALMLTGKPYPPSCSRLQSVKHTNK
jgi:hypothetical protein